MENSEIWEWIYRLFLLWIKIKSDKFQLKWALINGSCVHSTCFHNYNVLFPSDYSKSNSSFDFLRNKYLVHAWQLNYFYFLCALQISFKSHNQYNNKTWPHLKTLIIIFTSEKKVWRTSNVICDLVNKKPQSKYD